MRRLAVWGDWLAGLEGWPRFFFTFACGAMSALAFAPLEIFPALLLAYAGLVLILDGAASHAKPVRAAFFIGWAFGFGQFLVGLHWIAYPFLVQPDLHLWQLPFAVMLMPAGLALFAGGACALAMSYWRGGMVRVLVFAVCYAAFEWLRGHIFTGFPWNLPAYGWGASLALLQSTAWFGAYGLSFLTILLGASLAELASREQRRFILPAGMILAFAALWGAGAFRLASNPTQWVPGVRLRLIQPDIPQNEKYRAAFVLRNWRRLTTLSQAPGNPTHIIWPEAAPPFLLQREPGAMEEIAALTGSGRVLITGAERYVPSVDGIQGFNSLFVFGPGGQLRSVYDKFHLVPFGEYVPFAGLLNQFGITKLTEGQIGFTAGDGPHVYAVPGAPSMSPLICYEIIFPGAVTDHHSRPGWFVNVTDDSWFGPWAGPRQHFLTARVRAIEEGVPVARAANTGISAIIDPDGRIIAMQQLGTMGFLDGGLPKALEPTTYARLGDLIFCLLIAASSLMAWIIGRKRTENVARGINSFR